MPPKGSDLVFDHRHNAEMSTSSAHICARPGMLIYALDLADDRAQPSYHIGRESDAPTPEWGAVPAPFRAVVLGPLAKVLRAFAVALGLVGSDRPGLVAGQDGDDGRGRRTRGPQRTY